MYCGRQQQTQLQDYLDKSYKYNMCLNKTKPFNLKYNCLTDIYIYMCVISAEEIFNIDFFSTSLDVHNLKLL